MAITIKPSHSLGSIQPMELSPNSSPLDHLPPSLLKEMEGKSIFFIVENSIACEIKLVRDGKRLRYQLRQLGESEVQKLVQDKVKTYERLLPIVTASIGGALSIGGAAFSAFQPLSVTGKIVEGFSRAWPNTVDQYINRGEQAKITGIDGCKELGSRAIEDQRAQIQADDQSVQRAIERDSEMHNKNFELARTLMSPS